jgi:hypothetical protein
MLRIQCHRRLVGLPAGKVTTEAQIAAEAHGTYLEMNEVLSDANALGSALYIESAGGEAFNGQTAGDRLERTGAVGQGAEWETWERVLLATDDPDELFRDPWSREALLQPAWIGAGVDVIPYPIPDPILDPADTPAEEDDALEVDRLYINLVYAMPSYKAMIRPLVYPTDGQLDVPTSYTPSGDPDNPLAVATEIGFPITISVGSDRLSGGSNPYQLALGASRMVDEDGLVIDLVTMNPQSSRSGDLRTSVVLAAREPLRPGVVYDLEASVTWNLRSAQVRTSFRTALPGDEQP